MKFLLRRQKPDGSFQNLGATIYVLPSLVGALPYDVNKITCPENKTGEKIFYHERSAGKTRIFFYIYIFIFILFLFARIKEKMVQLKLTIRTILKGREDLTKSPLLWRRPPDLLI